MTAPLRDRLARVLAEARPSVDFPPWDSPWERDREHWRELADALLASEEWQARETAGEAEKAGSRPFCCPVCLGRGTVAAGFYSRSGSVITLADEPCRACQGAGIMWEPPSSWQAREVAITLVESCLDDAGRERLMAALARLNTGKEEGR